jgi:uncharacterized membrane protein YfcA
VWPLVVVLLVIAVTSAVHGAVGFGMNLLAVPVMLLLDPSLVPGPAVAAGTVLSLLVALREPSPWDRRLGWAGAGLLPGTGLALLLLTLVPSDALTAPLGALVVVAAGLSAVGPRWSPTPGALSGAGVASGFLATAGSIGGPPLALVYAGSEGARVRSNLSAFFVVTGLVSLVALAAAGRYGGSELLLSALLLPAVLVGFVASGPLRPWVDRGHTRSAVLWLSAAAGATAIVEGLVG